MNTDRIDHGIEEGSFGLSQTQKSTREFRIFSVDYGAPLS
jgi:hypothetical protein